MSSRELIILILGLAIVAVVLRGLFVALRARKGQIRLSIDKNIPSDIDLEALEMAELPSGGARVVARSLESVNSQNSALDAALLRAQDMQLGSDDAADSDVPILMDAVSLSNLPPVERRPEPVAETLGSHANEAEYREDTVIEPALTDEGPEEYDADLVDSEIDFSEDDLEQTPQLGAMHDEEVPDNGGSDEIWENQPSREDESADDVLLDYEDYSDDDVQVSDSLASIAPDYRTDSGASAEDSADEEFAEEDNHRAEVFDQEHEDEVLESDEFLADEGLSESVDAADLTQANLETGSAKSFEEQLEDFSLSAGERIGFNGSAKPAPVAPEKPKAETVSQHSLFDDDLPVEEPVEEPVAEQSKSRSFFSALKRSITPQEKPPEPAPKPDELGEPNLPDTQADQETAVASSQPAKKISAAATKQPAKKTPDTRSKAQSVYEASAPPGPSEVLVLNVMAREGYGFAGDDLLQVLITCGLKFGEMNIFHQRIGADKKGPVLFSVANVLNPGTFDLNNMDNFTTLGVSFFLALPTVMNNLEAFEKMLSVAQQVKTDLDGELKDDNRNVMTSQTIEHYRQRVRDFELRRLKAAGARN
jgi:cell division protein ZipA